MEKNIIEAIEYFKKVLKSEIGIEFEITPPIPISEEPLETPQLLPSEEISQPLQQVEKAAPMPTTEVGPHVMAVEPSHEPTETSPPKPEQLEQTVPIGREHVKELSMEALVPDIMDVSQALMNEIRALKEMLLDRISRLEKRVDKLEKFIPQLIKSLKERPITKAPVTIEHRFYTEETEILIREANDLLKTDDVSLKRLIKLEAIEWQILKAYESGHIGERESVSNLLKTLRMEISRLRRALLA